MKIGRRFSGFTQIYSFLSASSALICVLFTEETTCAAAHQQTNENIFFFAFLCFSAPLFLCVKLFSQEQLIVMYFSKIWTVTAVFTLVLSFFFLVLPTTPVSANNTCLWTGAVNNDWSDPDNWTDCDDDVPGVDDTAVINSGNPVVDSNTSVGSVTVVTSGGLTIANGVTLTILDTFSQNNEIGGAGDMVIEGHWYWLGGHHSGSGETTLSATGQMTITLAANARLDRTIVNNGSALWNERDIGSFAGDGLFINNGSFTVTHDATYSFARFDNRGSFVKTNDSGVIRFSSGRFTNDGDVVVEAGTLYLQGSGSWPAPVDSGSYTATAPDTLLRFSHVNRTLTADSAISANQILVSGGSLNIHGDYDVTTTATEGSGDINWQGSTPYSLPSLDHDGSTIGGSAPLLIEQQFDWHSGHINGTAPLTITNGATFSLMLSSGQLNRTVINEGTAVWSSGNVGSFAGDGLFINNSSFTVTHDATYSFARFDNQGSFVKTNDSGVIRFSSGRFTNDGDVVVEAGTLYLQGSGSWPVPVDSGSYTATAPDTLLRFSHVNRTLTAGAMVEANRVHIDSGGVAVQGSYDVTTTTVAGGTADFNSGSSLALPVLQVEGGSIDGDDPLLITETMLWTGGNLNGTAALTITEATTLTIDLVSTRNINRELVNNGSAWWVQGNISTFSTGLGSLINNGELTTNHSSNSTASFLNFVNNGRFTKTGSGRLSFNSNPVAQNNGQLHVAEGTLRFANGLDNYANNTLTGGTFVITGTLQILNADIHHNQADVALHTAGATIQTSAITPDDALLNFAENGADGRFALRYDAALTLSHTLTNSGELIVGPESVLTSAGYVQASSNATTTIELAGSSASGQYGRIDAGPQATLAGTFQVGYLGGFVPDPMDSYVVVDFAQRNGTFANFDGLFIGGSQVVTVAVNPTTVVINGIGIDPPAFMLYLPLVLNP
jgi:hypothetical protein